MHSLLSILEGIHQGDLLSSIDLTEAYLHVPVSTCYRKYLHFFYGSHHFQYTALPFCLSLVPRVFAKILVALVAHLHSVPICAQFYLDDILIQSTSVASVARDLRTTVVVLQEHSFSINETKSHLFPCTRILNLGAWFDSVSGQVFLSDCSSSLQTLVREVEGRPHLASLSKLLGKMVCIIDIVPWARFHLRDLQWFLLPFQRRRIGHSQIRVLLPAQVRRSFRWWRSPAVSKGCHFRVHSRLTITTDTSLTRWGGSHGCS